MVYSIEPIAIVRSCFKEKFGVPRQAGLAPSVPAELVILPPYNDPAAFLELASCSHVWLQFIFHRNRPYKWAPRIRPPRLGGNRSLGVFASRSPYRPNGIGLSAVRLVGIEKRADELILSIVGADLVDGTPVVDIKPYVPYADKINATNTNAAEAPAVCPVRLPPAIMAICDDYQARWHRDLAQVLVEVLQQNPSPAYHGRDPKRVYGFLIWDLNVTWAWVEDPTGQNAGNSAIEVLTVESTTVSKP